jgi:hypothetical protein
MVLDVAVAAFIASTVIEDEEKRALYVDLVLYSLGYLISGARTTNRLKSAGKSGILNRQGAKNAKKRTKIWRPWRLGGLFLG